MPEIRGRHRTNTIRALGNLLVAQQRADNRRSLSNRAAVRPFSFLQNALRPAVFLRINHQAIDVAVAHANRAYVVLSQCQACKRHQAQNQSLHQDRHSVSEVTADRRRAEVASLFLSFLRDGF